MEDDSGVWDAATHVGDKDEASCTWLLFGPAVTVEATWGVKQQMEKLFFLFLLFSI